MDNIGISIEGLGRPSEAVSGSQGTVWALTGNAPTNTNPDSEGDYTWTSGLVDFPTPSGQSATPETGEMQAGAFTAALHANEDQVTKVFLARQNRPVIFSDTDITKSATSFAVTDSSAVTTGDVIYVGAETMLVTGALDDVVDVERGYWNSTAQRHGTGAGIYTRPPFTKNRAVTLWSSNGDAMYRRARTYLSSVKGARGGTQLVLETEEAVSALSSVKRMRAMPDLRQTGAISLSASRVRSDEYDTVSVQYDASAFESKVSKLRNDAAASNDVITYMQIGGGIVPVTNVTLRDKSTYAAPFWDKNYIEFDFGDDGEIDDSVYELAVWNRLANSPARAPYEVSDLSAVVDNPWHPVVIAGVLMCSTDSDEVEASDLDMIAGDVGLGVPWLFGDEGIQAFIDVGNSLETRQIDQLVLGWDGDPVDVLGVAIKLMLSAGYYLASNQQGYLIPKKFETLSVSAFVDAQTNNTIRVKWPRDGEPVWSWDPGFSEAISEKTGIIGKTPMYEGFSLSALAIGASARINTLVDPKVSDYDFSFYQLERGIDYATAFLQRQTAIMRNNQPRVTFEAHDPVAAGTDYSIGEWAILDIPSDADPLVFNEDGTRRANTELDTSDLAVLITGREPARDFGAYKLTGRAVNYGQSLGRFRAPSAVVQSWDGTTNTITVKVTSEFSSDQSDEKGFTAGQQVQIYTSNLTLRTTTIQTVQDVSTVREIVLDGDFGVTPAAGDILELATYDNYTHQDFGTLRGYCYLADASDTLGSGGDDADEWQ